uniref:Bm1500 n=1 Tax=Brugia malayi TaxID=6279 RepID=A0A1I9G4U4_BRUMA|nr:Bm1500 [Brugia malayi]
MCVCVIYHRFFSFFLVTELVADCVIVWITIKKRINLIIVRCDEH